MVFYICRIIWGLQSKPTDPLRLRNTRVGVGKQVAFFAPCNFVIPVGFQHGCIAQLVDDSQFLRQGFM